MTNILKFDATHYPGANIKDFRRTEQLGVKAVAPAQFLQILKEK